METKICIDCKETKSIEDFYHRKVNGKIYYENFCKICSYNRHKDKYKEYRETHKDKRKEYLKENKDKINIVRTIYRNKNKDKINAYNRKWVEEHREEYNEKRKKYNVENKEKLKLARKQWLEEHKEGYEEYKKDYDKKYRELHQKEIKEYRDVYRKTHKKQYNEYIRNRRKNDDVFFWKHKIREYIRESFYRNNLKKNKNTEEILGCSIEYLRNYLKQTFKKNYGYEWDEIEKVHIDHIKPISLGTTIEEVNKLCHYTNLQLLKPKDNQIKSNKLDYKLNKEEK